MIKVFVPRDAAALSMGADEVAKAIAAEAKKRNCKVEIIRNGSRGMLWLEPLVEVETPKGRVAYGPVKPADVAEPLQGASSSTARSTSSRTASPKRSPISRTRSA